MTTREMSNSFSVLYNNITSNQAPGLTEYEKSVFLTQAQDSIVLSLYNGTASRSFEETEEFTTYLSPLVRQATITEEETGSDIRHITSGTHVYKLPPLMLFRTYESCILTDPDGRFGCPSGEDTREALVIPVTQDEFWRTRRNPFKGANDHKVLRLAYDTVSDNGYDSFLDNSSLVDKYSELWSKYDIQSYTVRYVKRPRPIILADLPDPLSIHGETTEMECELNPQIHDRIVLEAVNLAKSVWR